MLNGNKIINKFFIGLLLVLAINNCAFANLNNTSDLGEEKLNDMNKKIVSFEINNKRVKLNTGYYMPINGIGTWTLHGDIAYNSVYMALKNGVKLVDTARYYGNEEEVGKAVKKAIDEKLVKREELFITTKMQPMSYERAKLAIDEALKKLQLDYIDLFLIHEPGSQDKDTYKALEEAVNDKKIRSIGISNYYTKDAVDRVLSFATATPSIIQNENHIYYQNNNLRDYVDQYGIIIESWYPYGGRGHNKDLFDNEVIVDLAKKYNKTSAQIISRWHIQSNYIPIPGSINEEHIKDNNNIHDFEISKEDIDKINNLNKNKRYETY